MLGQALSLLTGGTLCLTTQWSPPVAPSTHAACSLMWHACLACMFSPHLGQYACRHLLRLALNTWAKATQQMMQEQSEKLALAAEHAFVSHVHQCFRSWTRCTAWSKYRRSKLAVRFQDTCIRAHAATTLDRSMLVFSGRSQYLESPTASDSALVLTVGVCWTYLSDWIV